MATPYIGEIRMFGGNFAPQGWAFCNGQLLAISQNETLFTLIGTTYGGDGQTSFGLPDLRSRVPIHMGSNTGSNYIIGENGGAESVTLLTAQLPVHSHPAVASNVGTTDDPTNAFWANTPQLKPYGPLPPTTSLNQTSIPSAGGNQPHDNMVPFLAVSFIIALQGAFPSQT